MSYLLHIKKWEKRPRFAVSDGFSGSRALVGCNNQLGPAPLLVYNRFQPDRQADNRSGILMCLVLLVVTNLLLASVALRLGHHAGLVLAEVLDEAGDEGVRDADSHLVGGHGGLLPASEASEGDVRLAGANRDGGDVLAGALERRRGELDPAPVLRGGERYDPVDALGDVLDGDDVRDEVRVLQRADDLPLVLERDDHAVGDHLPSRCRGVVHADSCVEVPGRDLLGGRGHVERGASDHAVLGFQGELEGLALLRPEDGLAVA